MNENIKVWNKLIRVITNKRWQGCLNVYKLTRSLK